MSGRAWLFKAFLIKLIISCYNRLFCLLVTSWACGSFGKSQSVATLCVSAGFWVWLIPLPCAQWWEIFMLTAQFSVLLILYGKLLKTSTHKSLICLQLELNSNKTPIYSVAQSWKYYWPSDQHSHWRWYSQSPSLYSKYLENLHSWEWKYMLQCRHEAGLSHALQFWSRLFVLVM